MRKSLRRLLDRLRTATNGRLGKGTSIRPGLQEPQRLQGQLAPVQVRSQS